MSAEPWVEDENHQTINGVRWVARECGECDSPPEPSCELFGTSECRFGDPPPCARVDRKDGRSVRWYRSDSPALAFFDGPKKEALEIVLTEGPVMSEPGTFDCCGSGVLNGENIEIKCAHVLHPDNAATYCSRFPDEKPDLRPGCGRQVWQSGGRKMSNLPCLLIPEEMIR